MRSALIAITLLLLSVVGTAKASGVEDEAKSKPYCTMNVTVTLITGKKMRRVEAEFYNNTRAKKDCEAVKSRFDQGAGKEFFTQCTCEKLSADY